MSNWTAYTGSDEQIAEMRSAKHGYIIKAIGPILGKYEQLEYIGNITHYWIIPADPLREMKVRQAMTGQPVHIKHDEHWGYVYTLTTTPDWNIPNAEYSFTPFKDLTK